MIHTGDVIRGNQEAVEHTFTLMLPCSTEAALLCLIVEILRTQDLRVVYE